MQGTSGTAVSALQAQLNEQNAGQAGYAPLKVDGLYGPLTAAGAAYRTPAAAPTIAQAYNLPSPQDPNLKAAQDASDAFYDNQSKGIPAVDESAIRNNTISQFQAEIDATNALYAQKLAEAKVAGANRVGSTTAINAGSGTLGSDFGNAQKDNVVSGNSQVYSGIQDEQNAAIQAILGKANDASVQAVKDKTDAIKSGLDSHLKYLQDASTRKTANATAAAQFIYGQKLNPAQLTPAQLAQTAAGYGVDPKDIIAAYADVKNAGDEAQAKKDADALKAKTEGEKTLGEGTVLVDANGKVIAKGLPKPVKAPSVPKVSSSTYKNFTSKPTSATASAVNSYIIAHGGNQAAIDAANGNEVSFYKVYAAAQAEKKAASTSGAGVPTVPGQ